MSVDTGMAWYWYRSQNNKEGFPQSEQVFVGPLSKGSSLGLFIVVALISL